MSSIDLYEPCICGSGKKLKFCKCGAVDHIPDLDKILRLVGGEQELAALDRINSLLAKLPNASWLLALKAELLLTMDEPASFSETAQRFLKLKPDNPLALIYQSVSLGFQSGPLEQQARSLLAGLAESGSSLPSTAVIAIQLIVQRIVGTQSPALLGIWGEMHDKFLGNSEIPSVSADPSIHLICKSASEVLAYPDDAPWAERLNEVYALGSSFRYEQAEKKLHSILRDYPNQPSPLSYLLRAQLAQLNLADAIVTCRKLAEHSELSSQQRAFFRVLQWELEVTPTLMDSWSHYGEIEVNDDLMQTLTDLEETQIVDDERSRRLFASLVQDEVPAKEVFQLLQNQTTEAGTMRTSAGMLAIFGKQTDKPARALLMAPDFAPNRPLLEKIQSILNFSRPLDGAADIPQSYVSFLTRNRFYESDRPWVGLEDFGHILVDEFLNLPLKTLSGKSPLQAAEEPQMLDLLRAAVWHLEGCQSICVPQSAIFEIYNRLGLQRFEPINQPETDNTKIQLSNLMDLLRIDPDKLAEPELVGLGQLCNRKGAHRMQLRIAELILSGDESKKRSQTGRLFAMSSMLNLNPDLEIKLSYMNEVIEISGALGRPIGQLALSRSGLLAGLGREEEGRTALLDAYRKYPNDPELAAFFEGMMRRGESAAPNSSEAVLTQRMLQTAPQRTGARETGSSLVLPGEASATPSESKLWLPGT